MKWFFRAGRENEAILKDLKRLISGKVLGDEISRAAYGASPSQYPAKPLVVVQPKDKMDVVKAVKYAASRGISITPRGSGSSLSGNSVGEGIVLDFGPMMNQILEFNADEKTVWVQPGLLLSSLNRFLRPHGLFFPVEPTSGAYCTLGGMLGNHASGPHSLRYGTTGDYVDDLEVVLSNGEVIPTASVSLRGREMRELVAAQTLEGEIYRSLPDLLKRYGKVLKRERPFVRTNCAGYDLWGIKKGRSLNLTPLLVGSEGTLGIITEAKLVLAPLPEKPVFVLIYLADLDQVSPAIEALLVLDARRVEILDRGSLDLSQNLAVGFEACFLKGTEALLVVEFDEGQTKKIEEGLDRLTRDLGPRVERRIVQGEGEAVRLRNEMKRLTTGALKERRGARRLWTLVDGAAVHPSRVSTCFKDLRAVITREGREGFQALLDGNGGDGTFRVRVEGDLVTEDDVKRMTFLTDACYDVILGLKGTVTARHGDGRLKAPYLKRQYPELYPALEEVKTLFDPKKIFNPGCIVGEEGKGGLLRAFVVRPLSLGTGAVKGVLADPVVRKGIEDCTGCGTCRAFCPVAQTLGEECVTLRGKVALLKEVLSGDLDPKGFDRVSFERMMAYCLRCKRCLAECPGKVDGAWISLQGTAQPAGRSGITFRAVFSDSKPMAGLAMALSTLGRGMAPGSWGRIVLEKMVGLDRRRHLPDRKRLPSSPKAGKGSRSQRARTVVYVSDGCGGLFRRGEVAQATLDVLERNGFDVILHEIEEPGWRIVPGGARRSPREALEKVVGGLTPFVKEGIPIVFGEPRLGSTIKLASPQVLDSEKARLVAERFFDIHQFLMRLHDRGELCLEIGAMERTLGYHPPCHLRALGLDQEPLALLRLIPGLKVSALGGYCCGMGGPFGMGRDHFDLSMAIGEPLFDAIKEMNPMEVVTSCSACRLQIFQGTGKRTIHPIALLALAYKRNLG